MTTIRFLSFVALIAGTGLAPAQPGGTPLRPPMATSTIPEAKKSALEEALEEALKANPDLRVAAAKVAEADAELARTRLQVAQKVTAAYRNIEEAKSSAEALRRRLDRYKTLGTSISQNEVAATETQLVAAQAKVAVAEAELAYLMGKTSLREKAAAGQRRSSDMRLAQTVESYREALRLAEAHRVLTLKTPAAGRMRAALEKKASFAFKDSRATDILAAIQKEAPGLHVHAPDVGTAAWAVKATASLDEITVGAALQYLEDVLDGAYRVVVRDYGLAIVPSGKVPPGALPLTDFIRGQTGAVTRLVEGEVTRVDEKGLVNLSIGGDGGVTKGQVLEVYRLGPPPKYVGQVRVVEVKPNQSAAEVIGKPLTPVKPGDRVSSRPAK